jgi:hypothetical protein
VLLLSHQYLDYPVLNFENPEPQCYLSDPWLLEHQCFRLVNLEPLEILVCLELPVLNFENLEDL